MRKSIIAIVMLAIVACLMTFATKQAKAKVMTRQCAEWAPNLSQAIANGAHTININNTPDGTYTTVEITCERYPEPCYSVPECQPYTVTMQHVYFYPAD